MKALIISFFCVILGYSFFIDSENPKAESPVQKAAIFHDEMDVNKRQHYISDTIEYFAKQKDLIYTSGFAERFF